MKLLHSGIRFNKIIIRLIFSRSFFLITVMGNLIIIAFSLLIYAIEASSNPSIESYLDALWWAFATATTVGYGDIIPGTPLGKIVGIFLMLTGTALFASYTALFAQAILEDEIFRFKYKDKEDKDDDLIKELKKHQEFLSRQIKHYESNKGINSKK
ncbi:potassium channel family protein [Bacteriovoracaceae bacterium]|nr:potassium channel family protein [Bacteriovoracaceae bacterium]